MKLLLNNSYNFLVPYNVTMIRLGNKGDGGYVIPKICLKADYLISLGLGTNWSFDKDWLNLNPLSTVYAYDGTIFPERFSDTLKKEYYSFFINNVKHIKENVNTDNIDNILNNTNSSSVFLKMDIEGHEYDIITNLSKVTHIVGMVIEFHNLDFLKIKNNFKNIIESLDNFRIVHVHANNYGGINKDFLPHTLEISFLRKDLCHTTEKRYDIYLPGLDYPNSLNNEDYMLYFVGEE